MTKLVSDTVIEATVGATRHATDHIARANSSEKAVYILHSQACKDSGIDLRECPFSVALDRGIDHFIPWSGWRCVQDRPVRVEVFWGYLVPELSAVKEVLSQDQETKP